MFSKVLRFVGAFLLVVQLLLIASPSAFALPAVLTPDSICTRDANDYGNPSICGCPDGYEYDQAIFRCSIEDINLVTEPGDQPVASDFFTDPSIVTKDINPAGYPSAGLCEFYSDYNPLIGKCVVRFYTY